MKYNLRLEALSAFENRMERRNHSDDTAACPTQPTCHHLSSERGQEGPLPATALSPAHSSNAAAALALLQNHTPESLRAR